MRSFLVVFALILAGATIASAQLYEWTDDRGNVSFTDNPDSIPAKYRNRAKVRDEAMKGAVEKGEVKKEGGSLPQTQEEPKSPDFYGGRPLSAWQAAYARKLGTLESLQARLSELKDEQNSARRKKIVYQRPADRRALLVKNQELEAAEARVKVAEKELADVRSQAESFGITIEMLRSNAR